MVAGTAVSWQGAVARRLRPNADLVGHARTGVRLPADGEYTLEKKAAAAKAKTGAKVVS